MAANTRVAMLKSPTANQPAVASPPEDQKAFRSKEQDFMDAVTKWMFLHEVFKSRNGKINGKLRFDIAPGSTICVVGSGAAEPAYGYTYFYGLVSSVTITLNSESIGSCGTAFDLMSLHTQREHTMDAFSVDEHPVYGVGWPGTPLISIPGLPGAVN